MARCPADRQPPADASGMLLRRSDQLCVATLVLASLIGMLAYWLIAGSRDRLVNIDQVGPLEARFEVDVNSAGWPELAQLPGIGEILARRIVESRVDDGMFEKTPRRCSACPVSAPASWSGFNPTFCRMRMVCSRD